MAKKPVLSSEERENLVAYLDGELNEAASLALEAKLNRDPRARAEADQLKRAWEMLDYLPRPAPSASFTERTMERITVQTPASKLEPTGPILRWLPTAPALGWAAAIAVAGVIGLAFGRWLPQRENPPRQIVRQETIDPAALSRDARLLENRRLYERGDSIEFVRELANPDDPDLFGEDGGT
jgi:anti-sigma factor RsiW